MDMELLYNGMINGMKQTGAKFIRMEKNKIYFSLDDDSLLKEENKLELAKKYWKQALNVELIIQS